MSYIKTRTTFGSINELRTPNGALNSIDNKPAQINYNLSGRTLNKKWYRLNTLHREKDKPAIVEYNFNDDIGEYIASHEWYYNGERHRENEPAVIKYYPNGKISLTIWYNNNIMLKKIEYYENGNPKDNK